MKKNHSTKFVWTRGEWQWNEATGQFDLLKKEGYDYDGPWALAHRNPNWLQVNFLFRNDDGTLVTATTIGSENTAVTSGVSAGDKIRVRIDFGDENNADSNNTRSVKLQYQVDGGGFADITTSTAADCYLASSGQAITDADNDATQRLSGIGGSTYQGSWNEYDEDNSTTSHTWVDQYAEFEFCIEFHPTNNSGGEVFQFQVVTSSDEAPTITNTPQVTLASAGVINNKTLQDLDSIAVSDPTDKTERLRWREQADVLAADYSLETIRKRTITILNTVIETDIVDSIIATKSSAPQGGTFPEEFATTDNHIELRHRVRLLQDTLALIDSAIELRERNRLTTDSAAVTDSDVSFKVSGRSLADALASTDDHFELRHRFRVLADNLNVVDLALIPSIVTILLDSIELSDATRQLRNRYRVIVDTIDVFDLALIPEIGTILQDTLAIVDSNIELRLRFRVLLDSAVVTDDAIATYVPAGSEINNRTLSDVLSLLDSVESLRERYRLNVDALDTSDNIEIIRYRIKTVQESLASTDAEVILRLRDRLLSDSITATDNHIELRQRFRVLLDTIDVVDSIVSQVSGTITRSLSDVLDVTDVLNALRLRERGLTESFTISDALQRYNLRVKGQTDSVTVDDAFVALRKRIRIVTDNPLITDNVIASYVQGGVIISLITLSDQFDVSDITDAEHVLRLLEFAIGHGISELSVDHGVENLHILNKIRRTT